jgi:fatty-acyl-CoA synthase
MKGLMQEIPLNIPSIVRHAERQHPRKTVATPTTEGIKVASFAVVLERARRLAHALRDLGVGPDDRVATFCWNHQAHLEVYVGVPCMGAILHTLNIRLHEDDLAYIVEHADDRVVVVDKSLWPAWQKVAAKVRCVRRTVVVDDAPGPRPEGTLDYEELVAAGSPSFEFPDVPETQAAAMCYTSGTTGMPKGVVYSHRSNYLHSYAALLAGILGLQENDVVLPIVPMFHANAWGMPYACLMAGADLVLPGRFMSCDALTTLLVDRQVTVGAGVPTIWQGMLAPMTKVKDRLRLRTITCGGAAVPPSLQQAYHREVGVRITHAWGMTETSPIGTVAVPLAAHAELPADALDALLSTQGRVLPGMELRIMKSDGTEAPCDGETFGEIQARGNWVASAYYKNEAAAEKFMDGWLRTGDVATIDRDGYVRIVDRVKDVIKSGGEWISSVKLEGLLMGHPGVAEAVVVGVAHPRWDERPLAFVVARPEAKGTLTVTALLDYLRPQVARFWLPEDVVFVDEVPKTTVGKFDKKVLRERFKDHFVGGSGSSAASEPEPRTAGRERG